MSDNPERISVMARLSHAIEAGDLTEAAQKQASGFLQRLETGVTIALCGKHGSGKSALLDVLLREKTVPAGRGDAAHLVSRTGEPDATLCAAAPGPVAAQALSHPMLARARILDVQGDPDPEVHAARHAWALATADLVLWCGQGFDKADLSIWSAASDALKDHSFLVLTQADVLAEQGRLKSQLLGMQAVASEEFHSVFPTTTAQAGPLLQAREPLTDAVYAASGVQALAEALLRLVKAGQQADLDGALLFLERHGIPDGIAPETAPHAPAAAAVSGARSYDAALSLIRARAGAMAEELDAAEEDLAETVLMQCSSLSEDLVAMIEDQDCDASDFAAWRDDVMEANDKLVLMCLEGDLFSASDAVTIVLQLSRDVQQRAFH